MMIIDTDYIDRIITELDSTVWIDYRGLRNSGFMQ